MKRYRADYPLFVSRSGTGCLTSSLNRCNRIAQQWFLVNLSIMESHRNHHQQQSNHSVFYYSGNEAPSMNEPQFRSMRCEKIGKPSVYWTFTEFTREWLNRDSNLARARNSSFRLNIFIASWVDPSVTRSAKCRRKTINAPNFITLNKQQYRLLFFFKYIKQQRKAATPTLQTEALALKTILLQQCSSATLHLYTDRLWLMR